MIEEIRDMIMVVVVPTQLLTSINESYIWILFTLSD